MEAPHIMNRNSQDPVPLVGAIPFVVLWPIIQLVAVPLIRAVLPWILERFAESIRNGSQFSLSDDQIKQAVSGQETTMRSHLR